MPMNVFDHRHSRAINRVLNYAHTASNRPLQVDQLADRACLSKFHFTRVFQQHVGEPPLRFLNRTRMERAASLLKFRTDISIARVASMSGFASSPSFSRKFSEFAGLCPREFRAAHLAQRQKPTASGSDVPGAWRDRLSFSDECIRMPLPAVITLRPTRVAYIRTIGRYGGSHAIEDAMDRICHFGKRENLWASPPGLIGISWDYSSMTPIALRRYDACVPVPDDFPDHSSVSFQTIPGGKYAVSRFTYKQPHEIIGIWRIFASMLTSLALSKSWYADIDVGPWYELYVAEKSGDDFAIDLYAPLLPNNKRCRNQASLGY